MSGDAGGSAKIKKTIMNSQGEVEYCRTVKMEGRVNAESKYRWGTQRREE